MPCAFISLTHPGRVRPNNEDAIALEPAIGLAVLADGMGGYNAGEVASAMATTHIARLLGPQAPAGLTEDAVVRAVESANRAIWAAAATHAEYSGMGTTVVVALFGEGRLLLAHVGDSRAYRVRGGQLVQLTRDHSFQQEQIDAGLLMPEEAFTAPHRNLVTRALGVEATVEVEIHGHGVLPEDLYLLCSDGLSDMLPDAELAALLAGGGNLAEMADRLVDAANARGGRDNISVILACPAPTAPAAVGGP